MKNINQIILFIGCTLLLIKPLASTAQYVYTDASLQKQLDEVRRHVVNEQFTEAVKEYSFLVKSNNNKTVSAEYAYALALTGCYDGAIMNLDKIIASGQADKDVLFYISQVLKLMEYDTIAELFWSFSPQNNVYPPNWISSQYVTMVEKHKFKATVNTDDFGTALRRANKLADQQQYIQSIVLFLELIETYPDQYLPCIGLSALLENLGFKKTAAEFLQKGIERMGVDRQRIDPYGVYEQHLEKLKRETNDGSLSKLGKQGNPNPQVPQRKQFIHTGLSYFNNAFAFNMMYGFYTSENTSFSINLGYTHFGEDSSVSGDLSFNFRWWQDEIIGLSLSSQYAGETVDFGAGGRVGWALPLSNGSSSIDFLINLNYYFTSGQMRKTYSIGYTRYF